MDSAKLEQEKGTETEPLQSPTQGRVESGDQRSAKESHVEVKELPLQNGQVTLEGGKRSEVETAGPADACKEGNQPGVTHALSLTWSFGFNPSLPVYNVSEGNRKMIFYSCSHTGVLYDCITNRQCLLQGHSNPITCSAVSADRRWLVTADIGTDCMVTIWDSYSAIPVHTIFEGLGQGCVAVAMSSNAQFVATISMGMPQVVCVWDWTSESDTPLCRASLSTDFGQQTFLVFNPKDHSQLVSNSEDTVVFYSWHGSELRVHSTPVSDKDFSKPVGVLSQSVFIPGSSQALTGTSEGCGVVWEDSRPAAEGVPHTDPHMKKPMKLMKMHDSPITVATTVEGLVVTGHSGGQVRFFNSELKLLNWYEHTPKFGPLASVSFAYTPKLKDLRDDERHAHFYPAESTIEARSLIIPDFSISTYTATIAHITTNGSTTDVLFREQDAAVHALAAHPLKPWLLVGSYSCKLKLWDYDRKEVLAVREFEEPNYIQTVTFDPKGEYIGVGFTNGVVGVLDALTLEDVRQPFRYARDCITHIVFSHDSSYMATADLDLCVTVYIAQPGGGDQQPWQFLAKHKAHYKKIECLLFGMMLDSSSPRLLSVGRDRTMVEYDLEHSSKDDLRLLSMDRVEQSAVPTAITWYPSLSKESFLLLANDQFKLKLYNSTTKMCRKTLLGPVFGSPLRRLCVLPAPIVRSDSGEEKRRYLAYITTDKVGLLLLPHDGNPHNSMCLSAHPGLVTEMACSHDGRYIFTAGGEDCTISMWAVNTDVLEAASLLGGEGLSPFYGMLEGGREGELFAELEEYFYYAQIRSQGPDAMDTREVSITVPIEQIPYIMRAIGFYPSEQEIEDMLNEVKFSEYVETGKYVTEIDLGDIIKLYINHRPVFGLSPAQLARAFHVLGQRHEGGKEWAMDRGRLLAVLQERGEHITESELVEHLMTLLGCCEDPETDGAFSQDPDTALQELPKKITAGQFAEELLGLSTQ